MVERLPFWICGDVSVGGFVTKFEVSKAVGAARPQNTKETGHRDDARTLAEYFDYWLDNHAALRCQPKTLERYRQLAESLIRLLGHISIRHLRPGAIQEAVNWLQLRGGVPTDNHPQGRPLAPKTVHSTASLLFTCLSDAARLEHIPANPMADRKVKLPERPKPSAAVMDVGAVAAIFQTAERTRLGCVANTVAEQRSMVLTCISTKRRRQRWCG